MSFKDEYLTLASWQAWCKAILSKLQNKKYSDADDDLGESPAIEVMKLKDPQGYFGGEYFNFYFGIDIVFQCFEAVPMVSTLSSNILL